MYIYTYVPVPVGPPLGPPRVRRVPSPQEHPPGPRLYLTQSVCIAVLQKLNST